MKKERMEAIEKLRKFINPGDTVFTKLNHVSKSGMMRVIDVFVIKDNEPLRFSWSVADAIGATYDRKHEGVKVTGCGMDMGFAIVYDMGRVMFPDGFGIEGNYPNGSKGRPTTKEMAAKAIEIGATFRGRNGDSSGWDNDGGYALNHRWL